MQISSETLEVSKERRGAKPGSNNNGGRKVNREKLKEEVKKELETEINAEFWVRLAKDKAIPKLEKMLQLKDKEPNAWKAASEIMNRAFGKPVESVELSGKGGKDLTLNFLNFNELGKPKEDNFPNSDPGASQIPGTGKGEET